MAKAARAIIIEDGKMLVMFRRKDDTEYYTLVGGRVGDSESIEQALVREVKEETGLNITAGRPVFVEMHPEPYNEQYIFLCTVAPHADIAIDEASEEGMLNRLGANIHEPLWVPVSNFDRLAFRTPQLQKAIAEGLKKGFPEQPVQL